LVVVVVGTAVMVEGVVGVDEEVDEEAGEAGMGEVAVVDMVAEGAGTVGAAAAAVDGNLPSTMRYSAIFGPHALPLTCGDDV
jgi:hypothetical protein